MITINGKDFNLNWNYIHSSNFIDQFNINTETNFLEFESLIDYMSNLDTLIIVTDKNDIYTQFSFKNSNIISEYTKDN